MSFVLFIRDNILWADEPMVHIWKPGTAFFNSRAVAEFQLTKYSYVFIYYDAEEKKIGFQFLEKRKYGAFRLGKKHKSVRCHMQSFIKYHKLDYIIGRKFKVQWDEENELFVIDVNIPINVLDVETSTSKGKLVSGYFDGKDFYVDGKKVATRVE